MAGVEAIIAESRVLSKRQKSLRRSAVPACPSEQMLRLEKCGQSLKFHNKIARTETMIVSREWTKRYGAYAHISRVALARPCCTARRNIELRS